MHDLTPPTPLLIGHARHADRMLKLCIDYVFPFLPATPPANLPRFPRLDFGLCKGPLGGSIPRVALPALEGLKPCFGTSGNVLSLIVSIGASSAGGPSPS